MKKIISIILIMASIFQMGHAMDKKSTVPEETGSYVKFKIKNMGMMVEGKFESFIADIHYDRNSPEKSRFNGTIQVESINTGIGMRDKHLRKDDYFDTQKYPEIRFVSTSVEKESPDRLLVRGNLTIKNVTKKIELNINVRESNKREVFTTALKLNRRDYNVGGKSPVLADDVVIDLRIEN
jgi:polyisoprenoid-binding protein YceI